MRRPDDIACRTRLAKKAFREQNEGSDVIDTEAGNFERESVAALV